MKKSQLVRLVGLTLCAGALAAGLAPALGAHRRPAGVRESKFFRVDMDARRVLGPSERVAAALRLDLTSVTTDQPQYWPNEKVYLKVLALGRPSAPFTAKVAKRDGLSRDFKGQLDGQGLAVLNILDGEKQLLELGEYRVDVQIVGGKAQGSATFAVVQGALGALSFAHEFKKVTRAEELDQLLGGWFLGNAAGAGRRWGNGLSFKNELRLSNRPYSGEVLVHSRCMLPGCSGVHAGPSQTLQVKGGRLSGTMNVSGHSGPFQIEVVTPRGSLRHQFEGSSHVERDMVAIAGGVSYVHRAGLAPYENTVQVPGRDLFVESRRAGDDPFVVESIVATDGKLALRTTRAVRAPSLVLHHPKADGGFEAHPVPLQGDLAAGCTLAVEVRGPYTLVTIGGFVDDKFREGWALGLLPGRVSVALEAPAEGRPRSVVPVTITAREGGRGAAVSAVLEVYDNRVPSRSPAVPLGSAIGDSVRSTSQSVSSWSDNTGILEEEDEELRTQRPLERRLKAKAEKVDMLVGAPPPPAPAQSPGLVGRGMGGSGYGAGVAAMAKHVALSGRAVEARTMAASHDEVQEEIREGERKVVFCQRVTTDASGRAQVQVQLPPQMGRLALRVVAVRGLDYGSAQRQLDVKRDAGAEARLPRALVPGARLQVPVDTTNQTRETLLLTASGAGVAAPFEHRVAPGQATVELPIVASAPGTLTLALHGPGGQALDRRELPLQVVSEQPVTYSRLVFGGGGPVRLAAGETARVYAGAGPLLGGLVMNVLTTTESWFGHAEALSARAAVRAVLLAAAARGLITDEGLGHTLRTGVDKDVRDLAEVFCDKEQGLCRPYPKLPTSPLWSAWVARNLQAAVRALEQASSPDPRVKEAQATARDLAERIRKALAQRGLSTAELGGFDADGRDVISVEIDGKVVYRVLTDDAVTRWATERLLPRLGPEEASAELALGKHYDAYRFLRAFERVGVLQYLTDLARAYYVQGDQQHFAALYGRIARGLILSQEPGLIQGPALLGGVYATPMALVRFLELQLLMAGGQRAAAPPRVAGRELRYEELVRGPATVELPVGAVLRADRRDVVRFDVDRAPMARVALSKQVARVGEELWLELTLEEGRDPLEYYALVAVPSTTSIKQTEDVLSDYRGQLIYGQQGQGGTQMQLLAVPFRGARSVRLLLEGAYKGSSPGLAVIRHIENRGVVSGVAVPEVTVR